MRFTFVVLILANLFSGVPNIYAAEVSRDGARLAGVLDQSNVEHLWPAGVHVTWDTGVPDGLPEKSSGKHTHCSAFVASIAKLLNVYILRPPEHGQILLANAQYEWLGEEGAQKGWHLVENGVRAQELANSGQLVVATYKNHRDDKPGHIAIVRPSTKSAGQVAQEGPQISQAGGTNYVSTTLAQGFAGHPAAFRNNEVRFYSHPVDWTKLQSRASSRAPGSDGSRTGHREFRSSGK